MNCFDIRRKEVFVTFYGKTNSIRDVQFHPLDKNIFCAASESGNVQLWDLRKPDHHYNQFTAHSGPVFTLHWHPEDRYWLSTGGRDQSIKIWDTQLKSHPTHIIQTIAAVNKIKWRPGYKYHIASCALLLDNNVNIWDIRRPYVPFAAFQEHKDVATGIIWQKDPDILLSCSKDKTICHHIIKDAERPAEKAPPVALSIAPRGVIVHAFPTKKTPPYKPNTNHRINSTPTAHPIKRLSNSQNFKPESSILNFHSIKNLLDETWIEKLAKNYKFYGLPFAALCDHNAQIADKLNLGEKAQTWMILKQLYSEHGVNNPQHPSITSELPTPTTSSHVLLNDVFTRKLDTPESFSDNILNDSGDSDDNNDSAGFHTPSNMVAANGKP